MKYFDLKDFKGFEESPELVAKGMELILAQKAGTLVHQVLPDLIKMGLSQPTAVELYRMAANVVKE